MGKITYEGDYYAPNAQLAEIIATAAANSKYDVVFSSGYRKGDKRQHGKKNAIDIKLYDNGKLIPNYQDAASFGAYEGFAQTVRQVQRREYPELTNKLRWGGYFSGSKGKYGALDLMHFDIAGDKLGMLGGSWSKGLTAAQKAKFPGVVSKGMDDHPVPQIGLSGEVLPATKPASIDAKRAEYASVQSPPLPRPRPASLPQASAGLGTVGTPAPQSPTAQPGMMGRNVSPALAAARERLTAARAATGTTTPGAMSVTPRMPSSLDVNSVSGNTNQNYGQVNVPLDQSMVQARAAVLDNGVGSLMGSPNLSPSQPNPAPYSPTMPTNGPGTAPIAPNIKPGVVAPVPMPSTARPAAEAVAAPIPMPRNARPSTVAESAPVPMPRDARPASQFTSKAAATPAAEPAKQQTIKVGKNLYEVGSLHKIGNDTFKIIVKPDGTGGTEKVNIDLLDEKNTIAGGMVGDAWQQAVQGAKADAAQVGGAVVADVGAKAKELTNQAGSFLTNLFGGDKSKAPALSFNATPAANTNGAGAALSAYANKGWGAGIAPVAKPVASTGLAAPGAGLTQTQQQQMRDVTKYRQVLNPAYAKFMAASGSGVQGLSPDERDEASAQRAKLMPGVVGTGIAAKAPPQYIQQAYTVQELMGQPASTGAALSPTRSAAPVAVQPKIYSSGGYLFAPDGKGGHANIGRDATFANRPAGSRGTAAGSDNNSRFETTATQRANYDRQGISY